MDLTCDSIRDITIYQSKRGYRFSVDALVLENFIQDKPYRKAIELGAGCAVVSMLLAKRLKNTDIIAVELQERLIKIAQKNVAANNLSTHITLLHEDIKQLRSVFEPEKYDLVFTNPPYRKNETGRISPVSEISLARHEITVTLEENISTASYLLKNRGTFCIIYHPFRLTELIKVLTTYRLEPKRMRCVHDKKDEEAKMVLIEAVKGAGQWLTIEAPLLIHTQEGMYTKEMNEIFNYLPPG
jgi:tRNA1Val (adenine37-N6)-methyltransferase